MHSKNSRIKKIVMLFMAILIVLIPCMASAVDFAGEDFSLVIPDDENVYYYTKDMTNMQGDMLSNAQKEQNLVLMVGAYAQDTQSDNALNLVYFIKIQEEMGADIEQMLATLAASKDYELEPVKQEEFNGQEVSTLNGNSTIDKNFAIKMMLFEYHDKLYIIHVMYKKSEDDTYLNQAMNTVKSMAFMTGTAPSAKPTSMPSASSVPTPTPTPSAIASSAATPTQQPVKSTAVVLTPIEYKTQISQTDLILMVTIGAFAVLIAIVIILAVKLKKHKNKIKEPFNKYENPKYARVVEYEPKVRIPEGNKVQPEQITQFDKPRSAGVEMTDVQKDMTKAFELKKHGEYIFAAKLFHDCVGRTEDKQLKKTADMQTIECLIQAKEYSAALRKTLKVFYRDYDFTLDEHMKLQSIINLLRKK